MTNAFPQELREKYIAALNEHVHVEGLAGPPTDLQVDAALARDLLELDARIAEQPGILADFALHAWPAARGFVLGVLVDVVGVDVDARDLATT